jgi:hypothetical protein
MIDIGSIVSHADPYHRRGASTGAVEEINDWGYQVWWDEDGDEQVHRAARTYEAHELIAKNDEQT